MNPHIEKLLSVCKEATPGEWVAVDNWIYIDQGLESNNPRLAESLNDGCTFIQDGDCKHITTFQPRNVVKLLQCMNSLMIVAAKARSPGMFLEGNVPLDVAANMAISSAESVLEQLSKEVE